MATEIDRLIPFSFSFLAIEYIIMLIFTNQYKAQTADGWQQASNILLGIFTGVGGYFSNAFPSWISAFLMIIHVFCIFVFAVWIYQSINPL